MLIEFILAFRSGNLEHVFVSPAFYKTPDGQIGVGKKKRVYPIKSAREYIFVDLNDVSFGKHICTPELYGKFDFALLEKDPQSRPSLEDLELYTENSLAKDRLASLLEGRRRRLGIEVGKPRFNAVNSADQVIARIPEMGVTELLQTWRNASNMAEDPSRPGVVRNAAAKVMQAANRAMERKGASEREDGYFPWPTTDAPGGGETAVAFGALGEGMLKFLGYTVGVTNGVSPKKRRAILDQAFSGALPAVFSPAHMREWSTPSSAQRLKKMAECIAAFARNAKRNDEHRLEQAIRDWESDLQYLFETYYIGRFRFAWPSTRVT